MSESKLEAEDSLSLPRGPTASFGGLDSGAVKSTITPVFLCGARDFHAMDWYRSAQRVVLDAPPVIFTDLIGGEGYSVLVHDGDVVVRLLVIDRFLLGHQSRIGNVWRNIVKALVFPFQVVLLRLRANKYPAAVFYAHSMYYLWLAWAARLRFVGTPQGSDILIKTQRSLVFRELSKRAMRAAMFVTVDSDRMAAGVKRISGVTPLIVQNGIDIPAISAALLSRAGGVGMTATRVVSLRGFTPLYRIREIVAGRNRSSKWSHCSLEFVYPFHDVEYLTEVARDIREGDVLKGRLSRERLYELFANMLFGVSIPSSDSSPRTVYEAIFCGAPVATTGEGYLRDLPPSMRERLIMVDLDDQLWFDRAADEALRIRETVFEPCPVALSMFDQVESFRRIHEMAIAVPFAASK